MRLNGFQSTQNKVGTVYLVGAGPGAADLITVRGATLLGQAEIVFHDALIEPKMLELCPQAIKVPVGKRCGKLSSAQHFINKRLVDAAHRYRVVLRLKGGDPMMFGRADEEIGALKQAGVAVQVVPGITAALAGAASIQQSLSLRGVSRSVAFITLAQANDLKANAPIQNPTADTLVYYMGRRDAAQIAQQLITFNSKSSATPVHILEAVSTIKERHAYCTLKDLANDDASNWFDHSSPALIMIGDALALRSDAEINDGLQDRVIFTHSLRRA